MNKEAVDKYLKEAKYNFAKSMPEIPHYYTLIKDWHDKHIFHDVVKYLNENGEKGSFYGREYIYYYANGNKYWTMDEDLSDVTLINMEIQDENSNTGS